MELAGFAAFVLPVGLTVLAIGNSSFSWFYDYGWFTGSLLGAALYYVFAGLAARRRGWSSLALRPCFFAGMPAPTGTTQYWKTCGDLVERACPRRGPNRQQKA